MADSSHEKKTIRFRCPQCTRSLKVDASQAGQKVLCPVCYRELIVPAQSQPDRRQAAPGMLYGVDSAPRDNRLLRERFAYASVHCPVCYADVAVTKSQINTTIECPDCGTKLPVTQQAFDEGKARQEQLRRHQSPIDPRRGESGSRGGDIYGVRSGETPSGDNRRGGEDLIPVYCTLCGTLMYARPSQIGTELTCPDCETKVVVKPPVKLPPDTKLPRSTGGEVYGLSANPQGYSQPPKGGDAPPSDLVPVRCPLCETLLYAKKSQIGRKMRCPDCGTEIPICDLTIDQKLAAQKIEPTMTGGYNLGPAPAGLLPNLDPPGSVPPPIPHALASSNPNTSYVPRYSARPQSAKRKEDADFRRWAHEQSTEKPAEKKKKRKIAKKEGAEEYNGWIPKLDDRGNVILTFPPPPRWPMAPSLFAPMFDGMFWIQWIGPSVLVVISWLTFRLLQGVFKNGLNSVNAMFSFILLGIAMGAVVALAFSARGAAINLISEFNALANGQKRVREWEETTIIDGFIVLIRLMVIELFVIFPTILCARFGIHPVILGAIAYASQILFFPVAFLSTLYSGHFAVPFNAEVVGALLRRFGSWLAFCFWSVLITVPFFLFFFWAVNKPFGTWSIAALLPFPLPIYTVPLCRLGWVVCACLREEE